LLNIIEPINQTMNLTLQPLNVSLNEAGSACLYSINELPNATMTSINTTHFTGSNSTLYYGFHNITFWCNDSAGNMNISEYKYWTMNVCNPELTKNWILTTSVECNGVNADISSGNYNITISGGDITIIGNSNITCNKFFPYIDGVVDLRIMTGTLNQKIS